MKDSLEDSISQKHNQQLLEADSIIKTVNDSVKIMDKKLFGFFNDDGTFNPWGIPYFTSAYQAFISRNKAKLENLEIKTESSDSLISWLGNRQDRLNTILSNNGDIESLIWEKKKVGNMEFQTIETCPDKEDTPSMVVFLHGVLPTNETDPLSFEHGHKCIRNWMEKNNKRCRILLPKCPTRNAVWANYDADLMSMIDLYNSKSDGHIYLCGTSNGAVGTWNMLEKHPYLFSAAMPVASGLSVNPSKFSNVPLFVVVESNRYFNEQSLRNRMTADVMFERHSNNNHGQTCQNAFTKNRLNWLFSH